MYTRTERFELTIPLKLDTFEYERLCELSNVNDDQPVYFRLLKTQKDGSKIKMFIDYDPDYVPKEALMEYTFAYIFGKSAKAACLLPEEQMPEYWQEVIKKTREHVNYSPEWAEECGHLYPDEYALLYSDKEDA